MRKLFISTLLLFSIFATPQLLSEEVVVDEAPVAAVVVDEAPVAAVVVDESLVTEEAGNPWLAIVWTIIGLIIAAGSSTIILAGKLGIKKIEKKLGIDVPEAVEKIAEGLLVKAINKTESWAKKQTEKPASENKMAETIREALENAGSSEIVKSFIEEKGRAVVEKLLLSDDTHPDSTPK